MNDNCAVCVALTEWERHLSSYRAATTDRERLRAADAAISAATTILADITLDVDEKPEPAPRPSRAQRRAKPLKAVRHR